MGAGVTYEYLCRECHKIFKVIFTSDVCATNYWRCLNCGIVEGKVTGELVNRESGTKHDDDKTPLSLLPFDALEEVGKVFQFGSKKYSPHNWRKGFQYSRLASACLRHTTAWIMGEDRDPETGELHTAHAVCCLLMLISHQLHGYGEDDRFKLDDKKEKSK